MSMKRTQDYGTRWESPSEQSPQGKFKDKTSETAVDGSYLEKKWINDISDGWNGAILKGYEPTQEQLDAINPLGYNADGIIGTPVNEVVDEANNSQVYNAWYKHTQEIVDDKIAELITLSEGCWFQYYSTSANDTAHQTPTTPSNLNFKAQASSDKDPIYNMNNFELNNVGDTLTFKKAGVYTITMGFIMGENIDAVGSTFQGKMNLKKPSDSVFSNFYTSNLLLYEFASWHKSSGDAFSPSRSASFYIATSTQNMISSIRMPTFTHPLIINIEEDNTEFQFNFSGENASNQGLIYNLFLSFTRLGKPVDPSDFQMPQDLLA